MWHYMRRKTVEVVPYNPKWPLQFETESKKIKAALGENCIDVFHVGSTAIPGLSAKPKIDIIAVIKEPNPVILNLAIIGYEYKGEYNIPFHMGFSKRSEVSVNLHVYEEDNPEIELNLSFRDYLKNNPESLAEYAKLKNELVIQGSSHEKGNSMFRGYTLGKDEFIRKILQKTGFNKLRLTRCIHKAELNTAQSVRERYYKKIGLQDPFKDFFNHANHIHFALNLGTKMIGYIHLEYWDKNRGWVIIRFIWIDESYRERGFGTYFLTLCERWLKRHRNEILMVSSMPTNPQSRPKTNSFFLKRGFHQNFFEPELFKLDDLLHNPLGKTL